MKPLTKKEWTRKFVHAFTTIFQVLPFVMGLLMSMQLPLRASGVQIEEAAKGGVCGAFKSTRFSVRMS